MVTDVPAKRLKPVFETWVFLPASLPEVALAFQFAILFVLIGSKYEAVNGGEL
jgi:ABC-type spermidine/putrescine transport system permease subunit II